MSSDFSFKVIQCLWWWYKGSLTIWNWCMTFWREFDASPMERERGDLGAPPNSESNSWFSSTHRMREARLALCHQTHCASLSAAWERRRMQKQVCPKLCDSFCGRNQRYSQQFWSQRRGPFLGRELYMWMLSSDATWVDKLAVRWQRNQRASLLSPDSSEIVKLLAADGENTVSVSVFLGFIPVVTELMRDDKNVRYASVFVFLFYNIKCPGSWQFVYDHLFSVHLSCLFSC